MKKQLILIFVSAFIEMLSFAQNSAWILAPNYHLVDSVGFGSSDSLPTHPLSVPNAYHGAAATSSQNIQMDASGNNILFFIVDGMIYDKDGYLIDNISYNGEPYQVLNGENSEIVIVPDRNNCNIFHLLSTQNQPGRSYVQGFYAKLYFASDGNGNATESSGLMTLANGDKIINLNHSSLAGTDFNAGTSPYYDRPTFAVAPPDAYGKYFVFVANGQKIFRFKIENEIFSYDNYNINYVTYCGLTSGGNDMVKGELEVVKLSNNNFRLAISSESMTITGNPNISGLLILDANSSGVLTGYKICSYTSNLFTVPSNQKKFGGYEFTPDGNRIFVTHQKYSSTNATLDYWNISGTPTKTELSTVTDLSISQVERAKDGNIYIPRANYLARITNITGTPSINTTFINIGSYPIAQGWQDYGNLTQLRILQDQIDGGAIVYDGVQPPTYHAVVHNVTSNASWTGGSNGIAPGQSIVNIEKELRIKAGVTLNIKNMTIRFAPGARLVIENGAGTQQGGKLTIDNTILTSYDVCDKKDMWLGVEVWGNSTLSQGTLTNTTQGVLKIENNSRIEHARIGALLSKRNEVNGVPSPTSFDNNRNGGIVTTTSSSFFNCATGIRFQNYSVGTTNLSTITGTTFTWNNLLNNISLKPQYHIYLNYCSEVVINKSNFYQVTPSIYSTVTDQGYGIYATNSSFKVLSGCSILSLNCPDANNIPSNFENLYMGIRVVNTDSKPFTVLRNQFINCVNGVYSVRAKNQNISRNKIYVHENLGQTFGIYVSEGTGYRIEENYLQEHNNPSVTNGLGQSYGILIDNSGPYHNLVYKNTFEKLRVGTQAQGNNSTLIGLENDSTMGLKYRCNTFKAPIYLTDIGVNGRIDKEQGYLGGTSLSDAIENAARNTFSMYGESHTTYPDHDIMLYPGSQRIDYVHLASNSHTPDNYTTIGGGTDVIPAQQMYAGFPVLPSENMCPTRFGITIIPFPFGKSAQIDSLNNLIDGGDKQNLLNLIASAPKTEETYNRLMEVSPYLSDEVLIAYIKSSASDVQVKGVLVANSGLSTKVTDLLKKSKRSSNLIADLITYQSKTSARKLLYNQTKSLESKLYDEQNLFITSLLSDNSITYKTDSIIKYLKLCRGIEFKQMLLNQYMYQRNYDEFSSLLNELSDKIPSDMVEYYRFQYDFNDNNSVVTEELMNRLNQFAEGESSNQSTKDAKLLLQILNGEEPEIEILPLQASSKSMMISQSEDQETLKFTESASIRLFPNPSNGIVNITLAELEVSNAVIQLVDLTGKEVFSAEVSKTSNTQVDLSHLKKGTYLIKVTIDQLEPYTQLLRLE